jgi:hypothetical protein
MKVISFLTDYAVVDRIIHHLKLTFVADRPPPPHLAYQELLMAAETSANIFAVLDIFFVHLLYSLTMAGGSNNGENATAPSGAKKPNYYI